MNDEEKKKILEWSGCLGDKDRSRGGRLTYVTPDNDSIDFINFQPSMHFYEKVVFPKLFKDKMGLHIFTFYDDINEATFFFVHIIDRTTYAVEAANVGGTPSLVEAFGVALLMYINECPKKK